MAGLVERQQPDATPTQHERKEEANKAALGAAAVYARALAEATDGIRAAVAHEEMSRADRAAFDAQVDTLQDQAIALATAAHSGDVAAMRRIVAMIDQTCTACHTRFRDYSGLLEPYRKAERTPIGPDSDGAATSRYVVGRSKHLPYTPRF